MPTLCPRCEEIFLRGVQDSPSGGTWGDFKDLYEATAHGCVLCQDLHRAFRDEINIAASDWSVPAKSITYLISPDELSFEWWKDHSRQERKFLLGTCVGECYIVDLSSISN